MPLENPGIRLSPAKPVEKAMAASAGVETVADVNVTLPEQPPLPKLLEVPPLMQEGAGWCWAACIAMVMAFRGVPLEQCEIVKIAKGGPFTDDPCHQTFEQRTQGCLPKDIKPAWKALGFKKATSSSKPKLPGMDVIKEELRKGIPVQAGIQYPGNNGHVVMIRGWVDTPPESLHINDSLKASIFSPDVSKGHGLVTLAELNEASGFGEWAYAWRNLDPHVQP